jgi:predicted AlkP superfamily pyrophosphatase or phosphodiesterase
MPNPIPRRSFLAILLLPLLLAAPAWSQTTRPVPAIQRVLIISIDGLRPDLALRADTPNLHAMLNDGSFTFWARTTAESVTLPSHTSMLTGVTPVRHGIQWNSDLPLIHPVYPAYPTLFELAKTAGYSTAMAAGKSKFINLAKPGTIDWCFIPDSEKTGDSDVTDQAITMLKDPQPQVLFVHLPNVDTVGHAIGWATPEQLAAIHDADACVGRILYELDDLKLHASTMIILTADHGGAGRLHGPDDPRSRHIPWLVTGPGIRKNLDLTTYGDLVIDTEDTFWTSCYVLGIPLRPMPRDGKVVMEIFDRTGQELIGGR